MINKIVRALFFKSLFFTIVIHMATLHSEPIDVVYTWVDGKDQEWQQARDKFFSQCQSLLQNKDANVKNRFRNRDELKYSLRSIYKFASFINHIYIITSGPSQRPKWLKNDPKITLISHQEIFPNKEHLPTFNSQAIEANLHRIPNLSERFLYLNDDFFLGMPVTSEDFFSKSGKICIFFTRDKVATGAQVLGESAFDSAWKNSNALLNAHYKPEKRYQVAHAPYSLTKSLMQEVEARFSRVFQLVSSHKFRMPSDFTLTNGLIQYHALYTKKGKSIKVPLTMIKLNEKLDKNNKQFEKVKNTPYKFFCVEDCSSEDSEEVDLALAQFFEAYFPEAAPWEQPVIDMTKWPHNQTRGKIGIRE